MSIDHTHPLYCTYFRPAGAGAPPCGGREAEQVELMAARRSTCGQQVTDQKKKENFIMEVIEIW